MSETTQTGSITLGSVTYTQPAHVQFIEDMLDAGLDIQLYHGRFFWHGPAVVVDDLQEALSATRVPCQSDSMGLSYVVYPKASDASLQGVYDENEG